MFASAYVWAKILNYLEENLSVTTVSASFDDAEVVELTEEHLILYSPSDFRRDVIRQKYTGYIQEALQTIFNSNAKLVVYGDEELESFRNKDKESTAMEFNPQFSFENFVVGPSNRFAHSASIAVSNNPGQVYNPLFIYGPAGVGKTHLLYAIANEIRKKTPNAKIVYIKGDQFTNELITAIQTGKNIAFRSKYREADLFLIDDIQFIAGKESTQEEFFHTFNKLYEEHKQIVMTSDRKPGDMRTLEDRLKTRFEWGLIADIQPPDYETRMAITKNKSLSLGLELPDDVCNFIAVNVTSNVRQIEGTVNKIQAHRDLNNMPLDLPNVSRVIGDMFKGDGGGSLPTPALIISQVCKFYGISESLLRSNQRTKNVADARHVAIYLIREITHLSLPDIGNELGRDHTTILSSVRKIDQMLESGNKTLQQNLQDITANINASL